MVCNWNSKGAGERWGRGIRVLRVGEWVKGWARGWPKASITAACIFRFLNIFPKTKASCWKVKNFVNTWMTVCVNGRKIRNPFSVTCRRDKQESIPPTPQFQTKGKAARNCEFFFYVEGTRTIEYRKTGIRAPTLKTETLASTRWKTRESAG